jgi:hypothetical protein
MRPRHRRLPGRRRIAVGLTLFATVIGRAGVAIASFSGATAAAPTLATATLAPASGLSAAAACNGLFSAKATLTWTATTSTFASGYKIQRNKNGNPDGPLTTSASTTVTQTGLATGTSYSWNLYAYYQSWTSSVITTSATTPGLCL